LKIEARALAGGRPAIGCVNGQVGRKQILPLLETIVTESSIHIG
jgi:hypothetical protein